MRESTVERYLHEQVERRGGTTRKFSSKTRPNNPDRLVIWSPGQVDFVECKAPKKGPRPGQVREHNRLRALVCTVLVIDTKEKVDDYVRNR